MPTQFFFYIDNILTHYIVLLIYVFPFRALTYYINITLCEYRLYTIQIFAGIVYVCAWEIASPRKKNVSNSPRLCRQIIYYTQVVTFYYKEFVCSFGFLEFITRVTGFSKFKHFISIIHIICLLFTISLDEMPKEKKKKNFNGVKKY